MPYDMYRMKRTQYWQLDEQAPVKAANLYAGRTIGEILVFVATFCCDVSITGMAL